jgi:predicted nucleic acid-binding Zn ribbon protein
MEEPRNRKVNRDRWELDRVRYQLDQPLAPARDMMALKDLLGPVADGLDQPLQESIRTLKKEWASIVGEPIAMQSEPAFIREGILYIFVQQSGWLSELSRMRGPLLRKIEGTYSEMNIRKLHFELKRYP